MLNLVLLYSNNDIFQKIDMLQLGKIHLLNLLRCNIYKYKDRAFSFQVSLGVHSVKKDHSRYRVFREYYLGLARES